MDWEYDRIYCTLHHLSLVGFAPKWQYLFNFNASSVCVHAYLRQTICKEFVHHVSKLGRTWSEAVKIGFPLPSLCSPMLLVY